MGKRTKKGGDQKMSVFEDMDIITSYPLEQAVADGVLVELLKHRWPELTGGNRLLPHHISFVR